MRVARARALTGPFAQVQRDSQQNDEEMGALLQHLLTSPRDEHQLAGAMEAPSPVEAGSQGVRPALRLQEEWAAFAAEHELCSEQELMEQLRADQLETERCGFTQHRACDILR